MEAHMFRKLKKTGVVTFSGLFLSLYAASCVLAADKPTDVKTISNWYDLPDVAVRYIPTDMSEDFLAPAYTLGEEKVQLGFRLLPGSQQSIAIPSIDYNSSYTQAEQDYMAYSAGLSTSEIQIKADSSNRKRFRKRIAGWFANKMRIPDPVTRLFTANTKSGFHLDVDPGDEYVLEWEREF
jgi:hypothetical protein